MAVCILVKSWFIYALKTFDVNKTRGRSLVVCDPSMSEL
jgi:hypothetical protein